MLAGAAACALVLAYTRFAPEEEPPPRSAKKAQKAKDQLPGGLKEEDLTAKFAVYEGTPKNAFVPLISGKGAGTLGVIGGVNTGMDTKLTGGEANWFYTGNIEVNGRAQALLENTSTGEAVYLSPGEKLKGVSTLREITPSHVVFIGPSGPSTVKLHDPTELKAGANVIANGGVAPLNPAGALSGPIGGQLPGVNPGMAQGPNGLIQPNGLAVQPDPNSQGGDQGRRNRGGRGRNRGNFGGGFGGNE